MCGGGGERVRWYEMESLVVLVVIGELKKRGGKDEMLFCRCSCGDIGSHFFANQSGFQSKTARLRSSWALSG